MQEPKVYVIVLNWNRPDETCASLESLLGLVYPNYRIILCDNASAPATVLSIRQWAAGRRPDSREVFFREIHVRHPGADDSGPSARITLIHTGENLGFAGGMNVGLRHAMAKGDADYCWILNNDTVVAPDALNALVARAQRDDRIGICGSTLVNYFDRERVRAYGGARYASWCARSSAIGAFSHIDSVPADPAAVERQMSYVLGASMLVSSRFLRETGLMDESYFLYSEEHDWAYRGMKQGFRLGYAPDSLVYHIEGATIGTSASGGSELSLFYLYRSKAMFAARHHAWLLPSAIASFLWDATKMAIKGRIRKSLAIVRGVLAWPSRRAFD